MSRHVAIDLSPKSLETFPTSCKTRRHPRTPIYASAKRLNRVIYVQITKRSPGASGASVVRFFPARSSVEGRGVGGYARTFSASNNPLPRGGSRGGERAVAPSAERRVKHALHRRRANAAWNGRRFPPFSSPRAFHDQNLANMEIEIVKASNSDKVFAVSGHPTTTIGEIKKQLHQQKKAPYPGRQCLRLEPKGKALSDTDTVKSLQLKHGSKLYYKDLGPQIGWKTVFLAEYAGPLAVYLWLYQRPWIFYGDVPDAKIDAVVHWAAACWSLHYVKRLLETLFVHRFSHATMPMRNLFKNCSYYWLFTMYVAYHVNHPLFTPPSNIKFLVGLSTFLLCELGNLSIHLALRDLRPPGTTVRKIPKPTGNPFTMLFNLVSCPNYTYEVGSWIGFTIMTQCIPAGLFMFAGAYQMAVWALGKHKLYKKEFSDYPKGRKAIIPFVL